jgi:Tfp pilus assembly protein PilF
LARALYTLISAVKRQSFDTAPDPGFSTEFLAASYYEQSRFGQKKSLEKSLDLARRAVTNSPQSGFAWERVAELEFCFGREKPALTALNQSIALAPRNAQALALKGFILSAQNQTRESLTWFERALAVDSSLGNAWLGRGICRLRNGDAAGGREDLLIAAALEPQRAELRSYLGKAYANANDFSHATKEIALAKKLDPNDPTAWLYSALLNQEKNQVNEAIRDLEKSAELNANRGVYRSQFLLDQDQAVRSANLAAMYRDAGMFTVSVNEAARAENYDYANYSAHLFLADSYEQLLDPNEVNLRYETPMENEYLLANLLSPAAAGTLSAITSQQEYTRLFEHDQFGFVSDTEYLSRGAWNQSAAQFGTFKDFSYSVEEDYHSDNGDHANNDFEQQTLRFDFKQQLTAADSIFAQVITYNANGGDLHQYYSTDSASRTVHFDESQDPTLILGYHHEWSPGNHTLFLFARVVDNYSFTNATQPTLVVFRPNFPSDPQITSAQGITMNENFANKLTLYSGELQQIWQTPAHDTIFGARVQYGNSETFGTQNMPSDLGAAFPQPSTNQQDVFNHFSRISLYGYHQWQITEALQLMGGLAYDWIEFPAAINTGPVSHDQEKAHQPSPKFGLIWTPAKNTTLRFAYTRSLAGANIDQSYQLEPSQVAGFVQSFRSIIPESVAAESPGSRFETYGISLEQKFSTGTYFNLYGGILNSHVQDMDEAFEVALALPGPVPSTLKDRKDYSEKTLQLDINQLLGNEWSLGMQFRVSDAALNDNFPGVAAATLPDSIAPQSHTEAILQQLNLYAIYNHPSGFFAKGETSWYDQSNIGYAGSLPGNDFWQVNALAGWRFLHRRAEVSCGLLNLTGQNYRLNPLNLYTELPRERTFSVRLKINF